MPFEATCPGLASPIALVLFDDQREMRIYVSPQYQNLVDAENADYLDALFRDFTKRASSDAASLFMQISALSVGPLITEATGKELVHYPELMKATMNFVAIDALQA